METQEGNPVGQVWQILPNPQEDNTDSALDNMPQVVATNGVSAETIPRIIYVTYQNPDEAYGSEDIYSKYEIVLSTFMGVKLNFLHRVVACVELSSSQHYFLMYSARIQLSYFNYKFN